MIDLRTPESGSNEDVVEHVMLIIEPGREGPRHFELAPQSDRQVFPLAERCAASHHVRNDQKDAHSANPEKGGSIAIDGSTGNADCKKHCDDGALQPDQAVEHTRFYSQSALAARERCFFC